MSILILCVDRDDDIGRKTRHRSPIVGRKANETVALSLGLSDPEESDTNALLAAIATYDELVKQGEKAEIATICGSVHVGTQSDRRLARQLDRVLATVHPTSAILVSDGADDEAITPLITSRVKLDAVRRVTVRQSQNLESTYYILRRLLADERVRMSFLVPLALAMLVFGFFSIIGRYEIGFGAILLVLAAYVLAKVFHLEVALRRMWAGIRETFVPGRVTLVSNSVVVLLLVVGIVYAYTSLVSAPIAQRAINFVTSILWFAVGGAIVYVVGQAIDVYLRREEISWATLPLSLFIVASGLFAYAALMIASNLIDHAFPLDGVSVLFLLVGLLIAIIGGSTYISLRRKRVIEVEATEQTEV